MIKVNKIVSKVPAISKSVSLSVGYQQIVTTDTNLFMVERKDGRRDINGATY